MRPCLNSTILALSSQPGFGNKDHKANAMPFQIQITFTEQPQHQIIPYPNLSMEKLPTFDSGCFQAHQKQMDSEDDFK